MGLNLINESGT